MAANCGELFLKRQQLREELNDLEDAAAELEAMERIQLSPPPRDPGWLEDPDRIPDDEWRRAANEASDYANSEEAQKRVQRGMNGDLPVDIGEGQVTNYEQLRKFVDQDTVQSYAELHQLLVRGQQVIDPEGYRNLVQTYDKDRVIEMVSRAYADFGINGPDLAKAARNVAPFLRLVDNMAQVRALSDRLNGNYLARVGEIADVIEAGGQPSDALKGQLFRAYKWALVGQRHFDLARRRTGQTLRSLQDMPDYLLEGPEAIEMVQRLEDPRTYDPDLGGAPPAQGAGTPAGGADIPSQPGQPGQPGMPGIKGDQPPLPVGMDPDLKARLDEGNQIPRSEPSVEETLGTKPEDVDQGSHVGQVMEAVAEAQSKPKVAARKIRQLKSAAEMMGLRPRERFANTDDWINYNMKYGNVLAMDSMLFQLKSHLWLNIPTNIIMSIFGPYRQVFENVGMIPTYGHKITRKTAMQAVDAAWQSHRMAMSLTVAQWRNLYMDVIRNGRAFYGSNQDLAVIGNPRLLDVNMNDLEIQRMRWVKDLEFKAPNEPFTLERQATRAWHFLTKSNAALRVFLNDQFGLSGVLLQPGLRNMVAGDNVGGYFFHNFKLLNELMMQARMRADLNLDTPEKQLRWVEDRFEENFLKFKADAKDIARYREEKGPLLTASKTDSEIAELISQERAQRYEGLEALEYGVPRLDTPEALEANTFSRQMRFQAPPESTIPRTAYGMVQTARQKWWAQAGIPFFQAPFTGALLDFAIGTDPIIGTIRLFNWRNMDTRMRARATASWITSMSIAGLFLAIDAADEDAIVGSGQHITDPREREEWETKLRAKKKAPNTIFGIPVSGLPVLNSLLLWKDMKEAGTYAALTKYDQAQWWQAQLGVLTGHLMRMAGVQQFQRIAQILTSQGERQAEQIGNFAGFTIGSFAIPGVGAVRMAGSMMGVSGQQKYRNRGPTIKEQEVGIDWESHKRLEEFVRNVAYGMVPFTQLFPGGVRKQKDHLGNPIRLPWGLPAALWLQDRFGPQSWPEGAEKTYAQLDTHNLLRTPTPLFKRELKGVRMNDELLEEYRGYLADTPGSPDVLSRMQFLGLPMTDRVTGEVTEEYGDGIQRKKTVTLVEVPFYDLLERHIVGNTRYEAFESLFNDPIYKRLMENPITTADPRVEDKSKARARRDLAGKVVRAVDAYYLAEAEAKVMRSGTSAAADWRRRLQLVEAQRSIERAEEELGPSVEIINGPAE